MNRDDGKLSVIIPVYRNEANLPRLLVELAALAGRAPCPFEAVFVVDGSPDRCHEILARELPAAPFESQLLALSRNFGSFPAVKAGLVAATGDYFAVLAADLQEPPELALKFYQALHAGEADVVFGCRASRTDPWPTELSSRLFWWIYRRFVVPDMPPGGVDVFACARVVRDHVVKLNELNTNLIALLFWVGFRRAYVSYVRQMRLEGKSAWTLRKKIKYCMDSIFSFTQLPLQMLTYTGVGGVMAAVALAIVVLISKITGNTRVPGYTPIVLVITFFGGLTSLGLGVIGRYLWLALENGRGRPGFIVSSAVHIPGSGHANSQV